MKTAVLLLAMGGPENLKEVRPFLFRLFSDPAMIRLPAWVRFPLACVLSGARGRKTKSIYRSIGGGSPMRRNTEAQASALETELKKDGDYHCFVGMMYSSPSVREAVNQIEKVCPDEIVLLPLYPQYSTTTTVPALQRAQGEISCLQGKPTIRVIKEFSTNSGLVNYWENALSEALRAASIFGAPRVLFSAHGLPDSIVKNGDPYPEQCLKTVQAIVAKRNDKGLDYGLCYQSRVGPIKWTGPTTEQEVDKAALAKRPIIIVPISFVCDHSETLYELNQKLRQIAVSRGCPYFQVVVPPGTAHPFIQGLARLVQTR